jgi:hypothetical protein
MPKEPDMKSRLPQWRDWFFRELKDFSGNWRAKFLQKGARLVISDRKTAESVAHAAPLPVPAVWAMAWLSTPARCEQIASPLCFFMSLAEIEKAVDELPPEELAKLGAYIRERENVAWNRQIDNDFADNGRLRPLLEEVREDIRADRLDDLP